MQVVYFSQTPWGGLGTEKKNSARTHDAGLVADHRGLFSIFINHFELVVLPTEINFNTKRPRIVSKQFGSHRRIG